MDAFGYAGIPVISIDKFDAAEELPKFLLTDRIGRYSLLTPLWQIVNLGNAVSDTFREYLLGATLRFLYLERDGLATTQQAFCALKKADDDADLPEELAARFTRRSVVGDGNCLFRALAVGDGYGEELHWQYRSNAVTYARDNFALVTLNAGANAAYPTRAAYFDVMSCEAESAIDVRRWGGYVETEAWARFAGKEVTIHSLGSAPIVFNAGKKGKIHLFWLNGNHYDCLEER